MGAELKELTKSKTESKEKPATAASLRPIGQTTNEPGFMDGLPRTLSGVVGRIDLLTKTRNKSVQIRRFLASSLFSSASTSPLENPVSGLNDAGKLQWRRTHICSMSGFFGELRRRKVYRIAVAYVVAAGFLIQIASAAFPAWDLPSWILRLVIALLLIGFPIALILAWAYDLTLQGIRVTPEDPSGVHPRRYLFLLVATAVIFSATAGFFLLPRMAFRKLDKSIAVLPLENLSEERENAYLADGIQAELLLNLAKIKDLKVISRTSVMKYKSGTNRNLKEIAQQLGVSNVLEGSVRKSGNRIRVSVQLIDAQTDQNLWVQNYDRTLADSLALQGELATKIAGGVGATLSPQEKARVEAKPTNNPAAYDAYLRGRAFAASDQLDRSNTEGAIRSYEEAVRLDPSFVLAWAYLSIAQSLSYWLGYDASAARLSAAKEAVDRAVALDPNLPETHLALGYHRYYGERDFAGALTEFHQAEEGLPNNSHVARAIALIHRRLGHWDEAVAGLKRAVELDPRNVAASSLLAFTYRVQRRFPEALATADRILALEPNNSTALWIKASVFWSIDDLASVEAMLSNPGTYPFTRGMQALFQRRYAEATDLFSKGLANTPEEDKRQVLFRLGLSQQRAGDVAAARATYQRLAADVRQELEKVARDSFQAANLHGDLGLAYAGLGEAGSAITEGQKAVAMHPTAKDALEGPEEEQKLAGIYALLGDADDAILILKRLLQVPYGGTPITPAWLRLDPVWDQIRNDPRFQELAAERKPEWRTTD
jgi:TolB-like protein